MASKRKNKKDEPVVVILEAELKDDLITELKAAKGDKVLRGYILAYKEALEQKGIEVFETFDYFLVCENAVYIALYEDEVKEIKDGL